MLQRSNLAERAEAIFPKRNGIKPVPVEGLNYDKDALTYTTPPNIADEMRDKICAQYGENRFLMIDTCGNIGGTSISFLDSPQIPFVLTYEIDPKYANMLRRNINSYNLGYKSIVQAKPFIMPAKSIEPLKGCAIFFDPPWMAAHVSGWTSTSESYILEDIKLGDYTLEEYLQQYSNSVYSITFHLPPGYRFKPVEGWSINMEERKNKKTQVVKANVFYCVNQNQSVADAVVTNIGGAKVYLALGDKIKGSLNSNWIDSASPSSPLSTPVPQLKPLSLGSLSTPVTQLKPLSLGSLSTPVTQLKPLSLTSLSTPVTQLKPLGLGNLSTPVAQLKPSIPTPSKPSIPTPSKPSISKPVVIPQPQVVQSQVSKDIVIRNMVNWTEFITTLPKRDERKDWLPQLQVFIYVLIRGIVTDKELALKFVSAKAMKVWATAFTHSTFDSEDNYESLETLGDGVLDYIFTKLLLSRIPDATSQDMTVYTSKYMSKPIQAEYSRKAGLPQWVRIEGSGAKHVDVSEDVYESIFGALDQVGNDITPGLGTTLCYELLNRIFFDVVFNVDLDRSQGQLDNKTFLQQSSKGLGWDIQDSLGISEYTEKLADKTNFSRIIISEYARNFLRGYGIEVPSVLGEATAPTKKGALTQAWNKARELTREAGFTHEFVTDVKQTQVFSVFDQDLVAAVKAKVLAQYGTDQIKFVQPQSTYNVNTSVIQLVTLDDKHILASIETSPENRNSVKERLLQMYLDA
jgi:dsRNA-specific ribonuclease